MGQYLSSPITTKESCEGHTDAVSFGMSSMQGWRVSMEDAHITDLEFDTQSVPHTALFSVFDGHGGKGVAVFAAKHLPEALRATEQYRRGDLAGALVEAYYEIDRRLGTKEGAEEVIELSEMKGKGPPTTLFGDVGDVGFKAARTETKEGEEDAEAEDGLTEGRSMDFMQSHLMRASLISPSSTTRSSSVTERIGSAQTSGALSSGGAETGGAEGAGGGGLLFPDVPQMELARPASGAEGDDDNEEDMLTRTETVRNVDAAAAPYIPGTAETSGCTALSVLVHGNKLLVANTGDSRCVLSRKGVAVALTLDHKPILFEEARRIIRAGGFVRDNRINGSLNVSRAMGDLDFKAVARFPPSEQMVVVTPDVEVVTLADGDEFVIAACDGIWDVLSNQEAVDFVRRRVRSGVPLKEAAEQMCDACLAPDLKGLCRGADNMSVIIILLHRTAKFESLWKGFFDMFWP